jgi:hypothetical protein
MNIYNNIFSTSNDQRAFDITVDGFAKNMMTYIYSVSVAKKIPTRKVLEVIFNRVLEDCNTIVGANYIVTETKSVFEQ